MGERDRGAGRARPGRAPDSAADPGEPAGDCRARLGSRGDRGRRRSIAGADPPGAAHRRRRRAHRAARRFDASGGLMTAYETPRRVTPQATVVLAANPGIMTLDGTNTWLLRAPDLPDAVVIDP